MIILDIETTAAENAAQFIAEPKPPGSMKKAETIAAWEREEKPGLIAKALEEAALSPLTGRVLAIGVLNDKLGGPAGPVLLHEYATERELLAAFWELYKSTKYPDEAAPQWVTFNGEGFDWPFLWKRSLINGLRPPRVFNARGYMLDHFIDLRRVWQCGDRQAHGSLDVIARLCGLAGKSGHGAEFGRLYADPATRPQALAYLAHDLQMTKQLAERML